MPSDSSNVEPDSNEGQLNPDYYEENKKHNLKPNKRFKHISTQNMSKFDQVQSMRNIEIDQIDQTNNKIESNGMPQDKSCLFTNNSKSIRINKPVKDPSPESFYNNSSSEQRPGKMNYPYMNKNSGNGGSESNSNQSTFASYI